MDVKQAREAAKGASVPAAVMAVPVLAEVLDGIEKDCRESSPTWPAWFLRNKILDRIGVELP